MRKIRLADFAFLIHESHEIRKLKTKKEEREIG